MTGITKETITEMRAARANGASYEEIHAKFKVGYASISKYLKDLGYNGAAASGVWREAEEYGLRLFKNNGFEHVLDLNRISPSGFFDILAIKKGEVWLIDVTINESKDLASKALNMVPGCRCFVLYVNYDMKSHKLAELKEVLL